MNRLGSIIALALAALMVAAPVTAAPVTAAPVMAADFPQNDAALAWLRQSQESDGGFSSGFAAGSDFGTTAEVILAAIAAGQDVSTWVTAADRTPLDFVASRVAAGQVTDVGDLSKAAFVAVATGQDPRAFGGTNLIEKMAAQQNASTGVYGDTLFKHAYVVLALHSAGAPIPESAVAAMTSQFTDDGAWALFGGTTPGTADTNTTALVMQALIAVGRADAAAGALPYLQRMQNADGGFPYQKPSAWGTDSDANSTAVVLQALKALGAQMGPFASSGTDPTGALLSLADSASGAYFWQAAVPFANMLATAQAVQATEGLTLASLSVVGASRPPQGVAVAAAAVPLLPESGASAGVIATLLLSGTVLLAGLVSGLGNAARRRR
ncbi:MAG: terpene cyclase/mutase family protein [Anaerolineae bacterium]|jgi:hypothetical protein|nr:terpene cyclase/mutase family protein [Anaerolineae bacterium]